MGLFSDSTRTYVATTTSRVIPDDKFISSVESGTLKSLFGKGGEMTDYILDDMIAGIGGRARTFWKYGKERYTYGLPVSQGISQNGNFGGALCKDVIEHQVEPNRAVNMQYTFYGQFNYLHWAYHIIENQYVLNPSTKELRGLSAQKGQPCTLTHVLLRVGADRYNSTATDSWKSHHPTNTVEIEVRTDIGTAIQVEITYSYPDPAAPYPGASPDIVETLRVSNEISQAGYDPNVLYFHVLYELDAQYKYWEYRIGAGTYPTLDNAFNPSTLTSGSYFPFVYFRYGKVSMAENPNDPAYISSKRMLSRLNMDYPAVIAKIHENPDIANVEQAMLFWGLEADSTHPLDRRYLYEYFDAQFPEMGGMATDLNHEDMTPEIVATMINYSAVTFQDARFKMALSHVGAYRRTYLGVLGPVGTYDSGELALLEAYQEYTQTADGGYMETYTRKVPSHYYRKQILPGYYEEILILGMEMKYFIFGEYSITADGDTDDTRMDLLLVPLDLSITRQFSLLDREELYSRSLHFIFNSVVTVTVKWYQSDFFQFFITVIALVIMVYTQQSALLSFAATAATMTATQLLTAFLVTGMEYLIKSFGLQLFVKIAGEKISLFIAVIAIAYGMAELSSAGSLANASPFAKDMLSASNSLVNGVQKQIATDIAGIQQEMRDLSGMAKVNDQLLGEANQLLEQRHKPSPYTFFAESAQQFLDRTVHSGNIGMMSIDAVSNYVERSLSLPDISNTIGEFS